MNPRASFKSVGGAHHQKEEAGTTLTALVTLILAVSVASERLVEIIKGFIPASLAITAAG